MPAIRRNRLIEALWQAHSWVYRASGGRIGRRIAGMPILLLTTTGRKSGRPRTVALQHLTDGESFVVIASHAGEPTQPAWLLNLRGNAQASVQIGRRTIPVRAREAEGPERARLWERAVAADGAYAVYERRTRRRIPVVVLEPLRPSGTAG